MLLFFNPLLLHEVTTFCLLTNILYAFPVSHTQAVCPGHIYLSKFTILPILGDMV